MSIRNAARLIEENEARFVDLRSTDTKSKRHHFIIPVRIVLGDPEEWSENGQTFDGSPTDGWKGIQTPDMQSRPDPAAALIGPFYDNATVVLTCDVTDLTGGQDCDHDPRSIARCTGTHLKPFGIGNTVYFGPEPEFLTFDSVEFETNMHRTHYEVTSESSA